jgi:hypothetical protein
MSITLVDINDLTASTSKDVAMYIVADVPQGGDFVPRKILKSDFFKLLSMALDIQTGAGSNDVITIDSATDALKFIDGGGSNFWMFQGTGLGLSSNGSTYLVLAQGATFSVGNAANQGFIRLYNSGFNISHEATTLTADRTHTAPDNDGIKQLKPSITVQAPLTGGNIALTQFPYRIVIVNPAGTIATLTITFPAAASSLAGDMISLHFTQIVTTLTLDGNGGTIVDGIATAAVNTRAKWVYSGAGSTWYRID